MNVDLCVREAIVSLNCVLNLGQGAIPPRSDRVRRRDMTAQDRDYVGMQGMPEDLTVHAPEPW